MVQTWLIWIGIDVFSVRTVWNCIKCLSFQWLQLQIADCPGQMSPSSWRRAKVLKDDPPSCPIPRKVGPRLIRKTWHASIRLTCILKRCHGTCPHDSMRSSRWMDSFQDVISVTPTSETVCVCVNPASNMQVKANLSISENSDHSASFRSLITVTRVYIFGTAGGQGLQWLPCPTKLCHWRGSNWGRSVVYLLSLNCWFLVLLMFWLIATTFTFCVDMMIQVT